MSSHQQPPAQEQVFEANLDAELFWEKNRNLILGAVAAVIVVAVGSVIWVINDHNSRDAAEAMLADAKDASGWNAVIAKYPHSMPAAAAYFLLAQSQRDAGKLDDSTATYKKLLAEFPNHPLAGGANLGIAENLDLQGKSSEAQALLASLQTGDPDSYVAPYAALLEGRMLVREGKLAEAHRVFSTSYNMYSRSPAAQAAGSQDNELSSVIPPEGPVGASATVPR